jgi:hypothetical protein
MEQISVKPRWGGFFLLILLFSLGIYAIQSYGNYEKIKQNWPKYRCMPHIMPFAALYGANTSENFNYCMKNMFTGFGGEMLAPFYNILGFFTKTLMGLLDSINSMRVMLATLVGGITTVFSEFTERLSMFFTHIRLTAIRMKQLMNRVVGIMFSVMYMGMSGVMSAMNFGDTVLFRFLDTFCFAPETLIEIDGCANPVPICQVNIGDSIGGNKVTAIFKFLANGQPMCQFNNNKKKIIVSTNHYMRGINGNWIEAGKHPDAETFSDWSGGSERPLICLNIENHQFQIGSYIFCDYDEAEEGDKEAMQLAESIINGNQLHRIEEVENKVEKQTRIEDYSPGFFKKTLIKMKENVFKEIKDIQLGDLIANSGKVVGIVKKEIIEYCVYKGDIVTPSTLVWCNNTWERVGTKTHIINAKNPMIFYNLFITPHSSIETAKNMYRDYIEVMSPTMRKPYSRELESSEPYIIQK